MSARKSEGKETPMAGRKELIQTLNEGLSREYQAVIACTVSSQVLKGAAARASRRRVAVSLFPQVSGLQQVTRHVPGAVGTSFALVMEQGR